MKTQSKLKEFDKNKSRGQNNFRDFLKNTYNAKKNPHKDYFLAINLDFLNKEDKDISGVEKKFFIAMKKFLDYESKITLESSRKKICIILIERINKYLKKQEDSIVIHHPIEIGTLESYKHELYKGTDPETLRNNIIKYSNEVVKYIEIMSNEM